MNNEKVRPVFASQNDFSTEHFLTDTSSSSDYNIEQDKKEHTRDSCSISWTYSYSLQQSAEILLIANKVYQKASPKDIGK